MFKKIKQLFKKKKSEHTPTKANNDLYADVQWLDEAQSPFGIAGVDCFKFTQSMISASTDAGVANKFGKLRNYDGKGLTNKLPDDFVNFPVSLQYEDPGEVREGALVKAQQMENKWDIYLYGDKIYFCRSWTGNLGFVTKWSIENEVLSITKIYVHQDILEEGEEYLTAQVDYLIKHYLFGKIVPHPLPPDFKRELPAIAILSFTNYGKDCCFATYEDTIRYKRSEHGLPD